MNEKRSTKLCKLCKAEIPTGTKICPNCKKKQGGIIKWIGIGVVAIALIGSAIGNSDTKTSTDSQIANVSVTTSEPDVTAESEITENSTMEDDPLGFNVLFSDSYNNDVTGNWRLARISENINIEEYALDYYNNYFQSDDELHIIINFTLNTTTRISVIGNILDVSILEYVDKEEHDAKLACSGMLLNEYHVNIDSGEIEKIQ